MISSYRRILRSVTTTAKSVTNSLSSSSSSSSSIGRRHAGGTPTTTGRSTTTGSSYSVSYGTRTTGSRHGIPLSTFATTTTTTTSIQKQKQQQQQHQHRTKSTVTPTNDSDNNTNTNTNTNTTKEDDDDIVISSEIVKWKYRRHYMRPGRQEISPRRTVPSKIVKPLYATTGDTISSPTNNNNTSSSSSSIPRYYLPADQEFIHHMRHAGQIAATTLHMACDFAQRLQPSPSVTIGTEGYQVNMVTTDDIDALVHDTITQQYQAYPSPLNYATFPKSVCTSVNEIICHGIPECHRELYYGDVISIDVSCYTRDRVHGDNCATVIVGDYNDTNTTTPTTSSSSSSSSSTSLLSVPQQPPLQCDWRNVPYRTQFATEACRDHFHEARRLMQATREALMTAISIIRPNESYLSDIGRACQQVANKYGYTSVTKYRGHGIGSEFHVAPFVKHYYDDHDDNNNEEPILLQDGMIFTIEPMLCQYDNDCAEWASDGWTVTTLDGGLSCQFEHTIFITPTGVEILTLPFGHANIGRDYIM